MRPENSRLAAANEYGAQTARCFRYHAPVRKRHTKPFDFNDPIRPDSLPYRHSDKAIRFDSCIRRPGSRSILKALTSAATPRATSCHLVKLLLSAPTCAGRNMAYSLRSDPHTAALTLTCPVRSRTCKFPVQACARFGGSVCRSSLSQNLILAMIAHKPSSPTSAVGLQPPCASQ